MKEADCINKLDYKSKNKSDKRRNRSGNLLIKVRRYSIGHYSIGHKLYDTSTENFVHNVSY